MMSLTFGLFNQVSGLGPLGPLVSFFTQFIEMPDIDIKSYLACKAKLQCIKTGSDKVCSIVF